MTRKSAWKSGCCVTYINIVYYLQRFSLRLDWYIYKQHLSYEGVGWLKNIFIIRLLALIWFHRPSSGWLPNADFRQNLRAVRAEATDYTAAKTIANATLFNWMCSSSNGLISLTFLLLFRRFHNCGVFDYVVIILILYYIV